MDSKNNVKINNIPIVPRIVLGNPTLGSSMDLRLLRRDFKPLEDSIRKRRLNENVLNEFFGKDAEWREKIAILDGLRAEKNKLAAKIRTVGVDQDLIKKAKGIDVEIVKAEKFLAEVKERRDSLMLELPNLIDPEVPLNDVKTLVYFGIPKVDIRRIADFEEKYPGAAYEESRSVKAQYDIIREYDLADEEKGAQLSGARFYYKKNELTILDNALSLYALKILRAKGFSPITPPYLVKREVEAKATTLDAFAEAIYKIEGEDLYLIPTAEHPIAAYSIGRVYPQKDLPIKFAGYSPAFRKEAGSHGKDTKGIYRNHHFNKVEQYIICTPDQTEDALNTVVNNQVELLNNLGIPLRVIKLPSWDMDKKALLHVDVEGWFPGQNRYGELGSHASVGSWQAARLNIKYLTSSGSESKFVNTIYGTMSPIERTLACVLENGFVPSTGEISIPKPLADISGIDKILPKSEK